MAHRINLGKYLQAQKEEILSPENMWFAGERLGHPPSPSEAAGHYISHGGADHFAVERRREFEED